MKNRLNKALLSFGLVLAGAPVLAQSQTVDPELFLQVILGGLILIALLLIPVVFYLWYIVQLYSQRAQGVTADAMKTVSLWEMFNRKFITGDMKPIEEEKDLMLDHAYDGIYELNNSMPPWLKNVFYITIAFAVVYLAHFYVLGTGQFQLEEYEAELAEAAKQAEQRKLLAINSIDAESAEYITDAGQLAIADKFYQANCAACHAADGGGGVGPNLTDKYWIHGGSIGEIFEVIRVGVPAKGMIPWEDKMNPEEIQAMASYILNMQGSKPAKPKEPQGELYEPATAVAELSDTVEETEVADDAATSEE